MKTPICTLAMLAICAVKPASAKIVTVADFFPNCSKISETAGRSLTVAPSAKVNGAYPNISAALKAAKPGDTISLMTGDYGDLVISGVNQGGYITIAAASGQTPSFTSIAVGGHQPTANWRLSGLTISWTNRAGDLQPSRHGMLLLILSSDNIIIDHNSLHRQDSAMDWSGWQPKVTYPVPSAISARQSSCVSITDNNIRNIFGGIDIGGDQTDGHGQYYIVNDNVIENFAGDGIDHYGSHGRIERNRITNGHDVCNNACIHNDGIQGWNYNHLPVHNTDVTIDGNVIIAQTDPNLRMPVDTLQGITIFDGTWDHVHVLNNIVVVTAWHGITLNRVRDAEIINNTLAAGGPKTIPWIMVNADKNDPPGTPYNVVIRNNVFPGRLPENPKLPPNSVMDHNLALKTAGDYADAFMRFDPEHFAYDFHPSRRSPVIGEGSSGNAPTNDIEGTPRKKLIDLGAYQSK